MCVPDQLKIMVIINRSPMSTGSTEKHYHIQQVKQDVRLYM